MGIWIDLKNAIAEVIRTNGNHEITGHVLQTTLLNIVDTVGEKAGFAGVATLATRPATPDGPVFYIVSQEGDYVEFGGLHVDKNELAVFVFRNGAWVKETVVASFGMSDIERTTLEAAAEGVEANSKAILATQEAIETNANAISTLQEAVGTLNTEKVDKVEGKGLSTNDYTDEEKQRITNIESELDGVDELLTEILGEE
jgi:hypothetical protein